MKAMTISVALFWLLHRLVIVVVVVIVVIVAVWRQHLVIPMMDCLVILTNRLCPFQPILPIQTRTPRMC